ncbi:MAG TPA: hydrogenase maturation protease [Pirellulaceae bacterium]|nr:hydrogenase maturation protease [Pirellulaceae bacterium]
MQTTCIVGLGSTHGDDQFGWLAADRLALEIELHHIADVTVRRATAPAQLLDWLTGIDQLLLIDACRQPGRCGELQQLNWPAPEVEELTGSGSHSFSVWQTLTLASELGTLPPTCRIWCAAGERFEADQDLSPSLLALLPRVVDDVLRWLAQ